MKPKLIIILIFFQDKIVIWNSKDGKYIGTIDIPAHYNVKDEPHEHQVSPQFKSVLLSAREITRAWTGPRP